ncbi:uncharacterized protein C8Q71DRAFT_771597 [Rhodofomes roseus]|uniref:Uncharacterized protein n=1 Tax=Rhodofomes roseus TaxID=34475 RepID=A0ABQ8KAA5_9APHY|nr:uncharacterized protein C8Q71DRAFT_771597 [Rhodofomes roseus]KAH9834187.1 hypothetical protein C8Q71DRAFT_771597 [Rhodofomes roseus]
MRGRSRSRDRHRQERPDDSRGSPSRRAHSRSKSGERHRDSGKGKEREDKGKEREADRQHGRHHRRRSGSRSHSPRRHHRRHSRSHSGHRRHGRSASPSPSRGHHSKERRKRRRSRSRSTSSSSSSSDSDDSRHRRRKEKKRRHKEKKERKKEKKKKKASVSAVSHQWGKYGIISESDLYTKEQEFRAWLVEERKINPETISKDQTKKEFARFVEDYNTATLPHEKFYHMEAYERRMTALRSGEYLPPADDSYDPNADLRALQSTHKRKTVERETYMSKEQLEALRQVQAERIQAGKMKLLGMDVKQNMGVRMDGTMFDG